MNYIYLILLYSRLPSPLLKVETKAESTTNKEESVLKVILQTKFTDSFNYILDLKTSSLTSWMIIPLSPNH